MQQTDENNAEQQMFEGMETALPLLPPVQLDAFEGPLDILLHLIRKQKMDIFDIPMATITAQYLSIIDSNQEVMASTLIQLKSRMLLPRQEVDEEGNEIDPRDALVAQLIAYEHYRMLAEELDELPRMQRDVFKRSVFPESEHVERPLPEADLDALLAAFGQVLKRMKKDVLLRVVLETMTVREQIQFVTESLQQGSMQFHELLYGQSSREALVTTFLAILELWRQHIIQVIQTQNNASITLMLSISNQDDEVQI